jgi:hypothetical protein
MFELQSNLGQISGGNPDALDGITVIRDIRLDTKSIQHVSAKTKLRLGNWMSLTNAGSQEKIEELYVSASLDQPEYDYVFNGG